jgi:adenylate cyclase
LIGLERSNDSAPAAAHAPVLPDKPSIAVLPFTNQSGDTDEDYFSDGITEEIITELSRFSELFVIARNSSFTYKGKAADVRQVGRELGVRYVLEGSNRDGEPAEYLPSIKGWLAQSFELLRTRKQVSNR